MAITLLHISDLHFGDPDSNLSLIETKKVIENLLVEAGKDAFLVISGDITYQGKREGYDEANRAFSKVLNSFIARSRVIVCPGNHDLDKLNNNPTPLRAFDAWSAGVRNDDRCVFSNNSIRRLSFDAADFLVINSSFHGDPRYGFVELDQLNIALEDMKNNPVASAKKIAVLHHHVIPYSVRDDISTTRNSYKLLDQLVHHDFSLVLHGHQHARLKIQMGQGSMQIFGVRSFRFLTRGFSNGASIYRVSDKSELSVEHFVISRDEPKGFSKIE